MKLVLQITTKVLTTVVWCLIDHDDLAQNSLSGMHYLSMSKCGKAPWKFPETVLVSFDATGQFCWMKISINFLIQRKLFRLWVREDPERNMGLFEEILHNKHVSAHFNFFFHVSVYQSGSDQNRDIAQRIGKSHDQGEQLLASFHRLHWKLVHILHWSKRN